VIGGATRRRAVPVDVIAEDRPLSVLRQLLRHRSASTRAMAVEALGRVQDVGALDDVVSLLHGDPSVEVRAHAARALGRMRSPRAVDALLAGLDEGPVAIRADVVRALGELGAPKAVPALLALLVGPSRPMAEAAADALATIGDAGLRVLGHVAEGDGRSAATAATTLAASAL